MDYHKFCNNFDFQILKTTKIDHTRSLASSDGSEKSIETTISTTKSNQTTLQQPQIPMKKANNIFWFGDLNFRVLRNQSKINLEENFQTKLFKSFNDYLANDELKLERDKGINFK